MSYRSSRTRAPKSIMLGASEPGRRPLWKARALRLVVLALVMAGLLPFCPVLVTYEGRPCTSERLYLDGRLPAIGWSFDALAQQYPEPVGFVSDFAGVIPQEAKARIEAIAAELEQKTTSEIAVATLSTTGGIDIHDYSVELFMRWGIGKKGNDNGILILAAIDDRKLWIKTGYGVEHVIPDAVAAGIYQNVLTPAFRGGDYGGGLLSAVEIIATRIARYEGITLSSIDTPKDLPLQPPAARGQRSRLPVAFAIGFVALLILVRIASGRRGGRYLGFPFWTTGGFFGGMRGGSFGGGFGGFGGGSCGGGGAGGGW